MKQSYVPLSALAADTSQNGFIKDIIRRLKFPARVYGWAYLIAWAHRVSGIFLVAYIQLHFLTLSALRHPEQFELSMEFYGIRGIGFIEWALAIPVIFHALNGGRLILFESFGNRRDDLLIKWVLGLSGGYVMMMALVMVMGDQSVSAIVFWLYTTAFSGCITWIALNSFRRSDMDLFWKLHRITASFMLLMIPAHMLFIHLNPSLGHDAQTIIERMRYPFIKLVDLSLVLSVLYHGGYSLFSIGQDYLKSEKLRLCLGGLIVRATTTIWAASL